MNPFPALACLLLTLPNEASFRMDLEEGRYLKVRVEAEGRESRVLRVPMTAGRTSTVPLD